MNKKEIGLFIKNERKKQGLSQKDLAVKANLDWYQNILDIEKGETDYGVGRLIKVAEALGFVILFNGVPAKSSDQIETERVERVFALKTSNRKVIDSGFKMDFSKVESAIEEILPDISIKKKITKPKSSIWKR